MNPVTRGMRNAFRNSIRTFSIVVILGLSIGLALAMLVARASVQNKIKSVKSSVGTTIAVSPAGARGFQGGGEPLTNEQLSKVSQLANITKVSSTLQDRLTEETSNLKSAIDAGTIGNRSAGNSGVGFMRGDAGGNARVEIRDEQTGEQPITRTFTPPVLVTGLSDVTDATSYGGDSVTFTAGQAFDVSKDEDVAVVGKALAEKNSLSVGSTFKAYGKDIKVVGIYDAGNTFANGNVFMPLATLQRLSDQKDDVTSATVTVNSIDNVEAATTAIKNELGDKADVTNNLESAKEAVAPLESVKTISTFSLIGAIAAGAAIILLTMVMIVRERRREIGVFKAIGASNIKVMLQFMSEAVTLTLLAMIAGVIIGAVAANPVTKVLVNNSTSNSQSSNTSDTGAQPVQVRGDRVGSVSVGGGGGPRVFTSGPVAFRNFGNNTLANAKNVQASVGTSILLYGVLMAFVIALVGSAIPALLISKIRPADVMRAE